MANWTYKCYDDGKPGNLWHRWYDATPEAQGAHDSAFHILEQLDLWTKPLVRPFDKNNKIVEVRLSGSDKIEYRVWGYFPKKSGQRFLVLECGYHKGGTWTPKGIRKIVAKRKKDIEIHGHEPVICIRPI